MSIRVSIWNDAETKKQVARRFRNAATARARHEATWARNEAAVYRQEDGGLGIALDSLGLSSADLGAGVDGSSISSNISLVFKNLRFIHAQMSSNPPSVVMRPQTSDQDDRRKADSADRVVRYALRQYSMQEATDQLTLQTLVYGTGFLKKVWDSGVGAILSEEEGANGESEITLEGDIRVSVPFLWNIYIDPDARTVPDIKYIFEKVYIDYDEACARWPGKVDILKKSKVDRDGNRESTSHGDRGRGSSTQLQDEHYNSVELLEYWETGLPTNGYLGRYTITNSEGDVLEPCRVSPFRFRKSGGVYAIEARTDIGDEAKQKLISKVPEQARLPYTVLTDIDVPNSVYGKSTIEYAADLQDNVNNMDSCRLDNLRAHGSNKLVVPESAELPDDGLSDSTWDIVRIAGAQPPYYMSPAQLMPDMTVSRQDQIQGLNDVMGMNESMQGQQSREQSAAAMQYATNQGNMIRRRLFNKYVLAVEDIYRGILDLVRKHWTLTKTIHVLGKEKALESADLKGADIDGGFDVVGEYGVSLSLDPIARRQEIVTLQPLFEKAGISPRVALKMMKLSELEGMHDKLDLAGNRQKEIFDVMIATGTYIAPKKLRDHPNMIAWALDYFMTSEFEMLSEEQQVLCERHIEDRVALEAQAQGAGAAAPVDPAAAGLPALPPMPALPGVA